MVEITVLKLQLEDGSFEAAMPFSVMESDDDELADGTADDEEVGASSGGGRGKKLAVLGVFVFLVLGAAAVKYLTGGDDDHEVEIETPDDGPVGVTVDTEDEE